MRHFKPITKPPKHLFNEGGNERHEGKIHAKDITLFSSENDTAYMYIKASGLVFMISKTVFNELNAQNNALSISDAAVKLEWDGLRNIGVFSPLPGSNEQKGISTININISHSCNISCRYCFADGGMYEGDSRIMSLSLLENIVKGFLAHLDRIQENGNIVLFGGEPLLAMKSIYRVASLVKDEMNNSKKHVWLDVFTNATLVDESFVQFIKENENIRLLISLDGYPEINDLYRKSRTFSVSERVEKSIYWLLEAGIPTERMVMRCTMGGLERDLCRRIEYFVSLGMVNIVIDAAHVNENSEIPKHEDILHSIINQLPEVKNQLIGFRKNSKNVNVNLVSEMVSRLLNPREEYQYMSPQCPAGTKYLAADCDGYLYPCHFFVGNKDHRINHVLEGFKQKDMLTKNNGVSLLKKEVYPCSDCHIAGLCEGICPYKYDSMGADFDTWLPSFCEYMTQRVVSALNYVDECYSSRPPFDHAWKILLKSRDTLSSV